MNLINKPFSKLICAASNTNTEQIKRLCIIYSLAGVDIIDLAADNDVINAAYEGIKTAEEINYFSIDDYSHYKEPVLMLSINSGNDEHFKKAQINTDKCTMCQKCINICPAHALSTDSKNIIQDTNSCYGCGRCASNCPSNAIKMIDFDTSNYKYLAEPIKDKKIKALEIHTGNSNLTDIKKFIEKNNELINNAEIISYSIESDLFNKKDLITFTKELIDFIDKETIIQIDGKPMGASNDNSSTIQTIAGAQTLLNSDIIAKVQLAGGCNHQTKSYAKMLNLDVVGIGYGTFARKLLLPYMSGDFEEVFIKHLKKSVNIAFDLINAP